MHWTYSIMVDFTFSLCLAQHSQNSKVTRLPSFLQPAVKKVKRSGPEGKRHRLLVAILDHGVVFALAES